MHALLLHEIPAHLAIRRLALLKGHRGIGFGAERGAAKLPIEGRHLIGQVVPLLARHHTGVTADAPGEVNEDRCVRHASRATLHRRLHPFY